MTSLREAFMAAIKSLLRGKSIIQALLAFWISPAGVKSANRRPKRDGYRRSPQDFLKEAEELLLSPIEADRLKELARKLKDQFSDRLQTNLACMLPSYNHQLPNGDEHGQYLALDVGGSTLRVALVELRGREARGSESGIVRIDSFKISQDTKSLEGMAFFDWMAERVHETVSKAVAKENSPEKPILMGLAWSFPIEQTSLKGGLLQGMGKGFLAANGLLGQDLGDVIKFACAKKGLNVELAAIVNDSTAALLSQAYINSSTRFGLILGTGVNVAVHLPVPVVGRQKFGARPESWFEKASHVIVNTELGMFGHDILPVTRWDKILNETHPKPDFQPLEHLVSGYYLGEMCRLALIEAVDSTGLFGGVMPPSLLRPYTLEAETLSIIEGDTSATLETACATFKARHPSPVDPTVADIAFLRSLASFVSRRSSAIVAASLFALWELKAEVESEYLRTLGENPYFAAQTQAELEVSRTMVAFNGSVIEHYPNYLINCQKYIDDLVATQGAAPGTVDLVAAKESSLLGAAVALACLEEGKAN
ncbi:Phosphotransferase [Pleurostoma richardsiae]|uniref:Phosphotransferase n=1 Tax=Pleurostoma richardsiae TaxID=41990 RepID=A0AA38RLT7_9PEZI|nr:Phosphotransferase [Pleurostoma richardsiae]